MPEAKIQEAIMKTVTAVIIRILLSCSMIASMCGTSLAIDLQQEQPYLMETGAVIFQKVNETINDLDINNSDISKSEQEKLQVFNKAINEILNATIAIINSEGNKDDGPTG